MGDNCAICAVEYRAGEGVVCGTCKQAFHLACAGLLPADLDCISELNKRWHCAECVRSGRKLRSGSVSSLTSASRQLAASNATSLSQNVVGRSNSGSSSDSTVKQPAASGGATLSQDAVDRLFTELMSIKSMQKSLVNDMSSMRDTQLQMREDINNRFVEFQDEMVKCNSRLEEHDRLLATLSAAISDIDARVSQTESDIRAVNAPGDSTSVGNTAAQGNSFLDMNDIIAEFSERQKRVRNIMLFGVKEAQGASGVERAAADRTYMTGIFSYLGVNPVVSSLSRVGTAAAGKNRPLRVVLRTGEDVHAVMRKAKKLRDHDDYKGVYISQDQTPRQQQLYNNVKSQLMARRARGESNLKIRMVSGTPTIINLN